MPKCITDQYGSKRYINDDGKLHREDGPAMEYYYGDKSWYIDGKLHREDGPAIEYADGYKSWFYKGELIIDCNSQEEFLRMINMKAFW